MEHLNTRQKTFNSLVKKLKTPTWQITIPLFILLGFLPIRILIPFCVDPIHRDIVLFTGLSLLALSSLFINHAIPYLLNNMAVQLLFYSFLALENFIYSSSSRFEAFYLSLSTSLCIFFIPLVLFKDLGLRMLTWYLLINVMVLTCFRLRSFFVVPSDNLVVDMVENGYLKPIDKVEDFNWSVVVFNMNKVSESLYKLPVENRLSSRLTTKPMQAVGIRYINTWISKAIGGLAQSAGANFGRQAVESVKKDSATKVGVGIAAVLAAYSINRDLDIREKDVDGRLKNAEANLNNAKANLNNTESELKNAKANLKNAESYLKNAETYRMEIELQKSYLQQGKFSSFEKKAMKEIPPTINMDPKASVTKTKALSTWEESSFYKIKGSALEFFSWFF